MNVQTPVVLLVEGDIAARFPLAQYLRECGFTVVEAVNAAEAKIALKLPELNVSVALASMDAEGVGFDLSHWMRAEKLDVRLVMSRSIDKTVSDAGKLCEEGPALSKPYEHQLVLDHIRQAMARRDRAQSGGDAQASRYA